MAKNKHLGNERFLYSNWFFTDLGGNKCLVIFEQILKISIIVSSHHFWSDHSECILGYNLDQLVRILMKLSNHQIPCFKKIVYQGILPVLIWKWVQKGNSVEVRCFILEREEARSRKTPGEPVRGDLGHPRRHIIRRSAWRVVPEVHQPC